jgi:predicted PurR-regulated permease PerM
MWSGSSASAVVNGAAGMIIAALLIAGLYAGQDLLIPLALAGLLGFLLASPVRRLGGWGLPNGLAVATVITCADQGAYRAGAGEAAGVLQLRL